MDMVTSVIDSNFEHARTGTVTGVASGSGSTFGCSTLTIKCWRILRQRAAGAASDQQHDHDAKGDPLVQHLMAPDGEET